MKYICICGLALYVLPGGAAVGAVQVDETPYAVLEAAVDSLPLFLRESWGRPAALNLNMVRAPRSVLRPEASRADVLLLDSAWVEAQIRTKSWVVGRCAEGLGWECELGDAEMNVQFDWRLGEEGQDVVEVLVMFNRRTGGPPGGRGGFGADVLARFEQGPNGWRLVEHRLIRIT